MIVLEPYRRGPFWWRMLPAPKDDRPPQWLFNPRLHHPTIPLMIRTPEWIDRPHPLPNPVQP